MKFNLSYRIARMLLVALLLTVSLPAILEARESANFSPADSHFFYTRALADVPMMQEDSTISVNGQNSDSQRLIFTVKTNLLYDLATAFNIEFEVPIFDRYSINIEENYPWWETGYKYCLEILSLSPEFRFWFTKWDRESDAKMQGWFAGVYGMSAKYDVQLNVSLNYQGEFFSAGLCGGYVHQLKRLFGKPTHARLEFSVAAGFLQTDFRHYLPTDDYTMLIRDKYNVGRVSYFGPTKAKVSIVVPVFVKNDRTR